MHHDIYPIETAASMRIDELRRRASNRHLSRQLSRQRRQALAKSIIAAMRGALDTIESRLQDSEPAVSPQAIR